MYNRREDSVRILIIDDDPGHRLLIKKNLRRSGISNEIIQLSDGEQALDFIFCRNEYSGRDTRGPLFVMLDLNMPVLDGYQVLKQMKADSRARHIPVVILTTTEDSREIEKCYELGCNIYITKPIDYTEFAEAMRKVGLFLSVVRVPEELAL